MFHARKLDQGRRRPQHSEVHKTYLLVDVGIRLIGRVDELDVTVNHSLQLGRAILEHGTKDKTKKLASSIIIIIIIIQHEVSLAIQ